MSHARNVIQGVIADLRALEFGEEYDPLYSTWRVGDATQKLAEILDCVPNTPFDKRCADALADEVDLLVCRKVIDSRSPAADALLSYRDPPTSPRSEHLLEIERHDALEREIAMLRAELDRVKTELEGLRLQEMRY